MVSSHVERQRLPAACSAGTGRSAPGARGRGDAAPQSPPHSTAASTAEPTAAPIAAVSSAADPAPLVPGDAVALAGDAAGDADTAGHTTVADCTPPKPARAKHAELRKKMGPLQAVQPAAEQKLMLPSAPGVPPHWTIYDVVPTGRGRGVRQGRLGWASTRGSV